MFGVLKNIILLYFIVYACLYGSVCNVLYLLSFLLCETTFVSDWITVLSDLTNDELEFWERYFHMEYRLLGELIQDSPIRTLLDNYNYGHFTY